MYVDDVWQTLFVSVHVVFGSFHIIRPLVHLEKPLANHTRNTFQLGLADPGTALIKIEH